MRITLVVAVACFSVVVVTTAKDAEAAIRRQTSIAAQDLAPALRTLAKECDVQLVYRTELVGDHRTSGAAGDLTFEEALTQLLRGTGLTYRYLENNAITIVPIPPGSSSAPSTSIQQKGSRTGATGEDGESGNQSRAGDQRKSFWDRFRLAQVDQAAPSRSDTGSGSPVKLEEVIVTAQKRSENLQNVPIAVTVVGAEALSAAGISKVNELSLVTPGLTITMQGGAFMLPRIRGVGQSGAPLGGENPVAVYVDGVYYASPSGALFALNSISQISVLKGPQGTLFGRNATGGLIQVTTLDPSSEFSGNASVTSGNRDTYGGAFYVTGGLAPNIAADLTAYYNDQIHGNGTNLVNGRYIGTVKDVAVRGKIKADLGEDTTMRLAADYSRTRAGEPAYRSEYGTLPINKAPFTGGQFDIESDTQPFAITQQAGASLTIDHDFAGIKLTSISAYRGVDTSGALDNDGLPAPTTVFVPDAQTFVTVFGRERTFSQELQLSSAVSGPFKWTAGLYYFQMKANYGPPVIINQLNGLSVITINSDLTTKAYAGYAQATYAVSDRLNVTAGLRYTREDRDISGNLGVAIAGTQILFIPSSGSLANGQATWRLAADYRLSDEVLAYISDNRGFKSGGFNPTEIPYRSFEPERIDAYEAGLKVDVLDSRLRVNPAMFYYDYANLQATIFQGGVLMTQNAASARIYGLDLDLQAAASAQLTLTGGLSVLHARYGFYRGAQISTPDPVNGGNIISAADLRGKRLPNTPDWTVNLGAEYAIPVREAEIRLAANYYYNDGFFGDPENRLRQDGYHLVNASIEYRSPHGYRVSAWAKNIGDKAYASQLYTSDAGDKIQVAPRRTFGLTLGLEF
ncbi:MAG TPA: TonB-dependent receptor [Steroidobacteraceae bacterium]|nr:TonB-dependent receptor [Steroidobacteraceae bacterium]